MRSLWLLLLLLVPAQQEAPLTIVSQTSVRRIPNAEMGEAPLPRQLKEFDGLETTIRIRNGTARIDSSRAVTGIPPGSYWLTQADGATVVVTPSTKTYYRLPALPSPPSAPGGEPTWTTTRTGERSEMLGFPVERVKSEMRIPIDLPPELREAMPAEMRDLTVAIDAWVTSALSMKGLSHAMMPINMSPSQPHIKGAFDGLALRQVVRLPMLPAEIETAVVSISRSSLENALFDIPSDFREVPAPPRGR